MPSRLFCTFSIVLAALLSPSIGGADEQWPQFRGPTGDGQSSATDLPIRWSETENIVWQTPIHGRGWSSPVVWDDQIWMTTATEDGRRMAAVCVDRESGKIVHDILMLEGHEPEEIHTLNSYASPTPVIEAGRVYVHFGSYGTKCLDTATGRTVWERCDLECDHYRGPGSSPVLCGDRLILHFDGIDVQYIVALDKTTGKTVWKTDRSTDFGTLDGDLRKAYSTPTIVPLDGRLRMFSPGAQAAWAYDAETGKELWTVRYPGGYSNVSRPLFVDGLVLLNTGFGRPQLWAVRCGGHGDVTDTHVVWKVTKNIPAKPTPVIVDGLIYMASDTGIASCLDAATGKTIWQQRIGGAYSASPIHAAGRIYFFSHEGKTTVIEPGREYKELAVNQLDDGFMASPAVVGKAIYLRTKTRLIRVESEKVSGSGDQTTYLFATVEVTSCQ
ncbi:MAG: PQQ-binding-like beta-propeller repeat protein [Planctomycetes bacterium]|nr:PQQ-binding-like beta-propeller repeat protein [Planctomycetota bacterium]